MDDDQLLAFLIQATTLLVKMRSEQRGAAASPPPSNAGPRFDAAKTYTVEEEGFSRWMGWRGEEEQSRELASTDPQALKEIRIERSREQLRKRNRELNRFVRFLRDECDKLLKSGN